MEYDDQPLDLSLPKKKMDFMMTMKREKRKADSFFNDIQPMVFPATRRNFIQKTNLEDPAILERTLRQIDTFDSVPLLLDPDDFHAIPLTNKIENESTYGPSGKSSSFEEETASPVDESNRFVDTKMNKSLTVATLLDDDDDNCSTGSDVMSIFAPSLSDTFYSDSDEDSIKVTRNVKKRTRGRNLEERAMDEQINEIFALTIKNSPKMISPINDPIRLVIEPRSNSKAKRQLVEFRDGSSPIMELEDTDSTEFRDEVKRPKYLNSSSQDATELNPSEHTIESNAPTNNIVGVATEIDESKPLGERKLLSGVKFRSKIDFKNLEKITIRTGGRKTRTVSMQSANAPIAAISEPSLSAETYKEQINIVPVHSTSPPQFQPSLEQPFIVKSEPILQPKNSFRIIVAQTQSAQQEVLESVHGQFALPKRNVRTGSQSAIPLMRETSHGMQSVPIQPTPWLFQPSREKPLTILSIDMVQNSATHSQSAVLMTSETLDRMQSMSMPTQITPPQFQPPQFQPAPFQPTQFQPAPFQPPQFQPAPFQPTQFQPPPSIIRPVPIPQPTEPQPDWRQENLITLSPPKQSPDNSLHPDKKLRYKMATLKLFEHPCINYLSDKPCTVPISCPYNHHLPQSEKILAKMHTYPNEKIHFIYQTFIAKSLPTFSKYFPWICCLFGMRNMEETLASSIRHCDKYVRYDYYKFVFGGLLMCGRSDKQALEIIADLVDICEGNMAAIQELMKNPINPFLVE